MYSVHQGFSKSVADSFLLNRCNQLGSPLAPSMNRQQEGTLKLCFRVCISDKSNRTLQVTFSFQLKGNKSIQLGLDLTAQVFLIKILTSAHLQRTYWTAYLNLLLEILDVVDSQIQHVRCVGLLQEMEVCRLQTSQLWSGLHIENLLTTHTMSMSYCLLGCRRYRMWSTLSMFGTSSCSFRIRSLIFVLLTWAPQISTSANCSAADSKLKGILCKKMDSLTLSAMLRG